MKKLRVAVIHTDPSWESSGSDLNPGGIKKMQKTINAISRAITELGHDFLVLPGNYQSLDVLKEKNVDLVFNLCTGISEKNTQVLFAGILERTGIPFTGSGMRTHLLALHKDLAKICFIQNGILTPEFMVARSSETPLLNELDFPLFIKPVHEGSSMGLPGGGMCKTIQEYTEGLNFLLGKYRQPVLVEKFIPGREFTVGIMGNNSPVVLPILELDFSEVNPDNYTNYYIKRQRAMKTICPACLEDYLRKRIEELALQAYLALGCQDYARVDMRLTPQGELYVLEVNTLPALYPGSSMTIMADKAGIKYRELVGSIITSALDRVRVYAA